MNVLRLLKEFKIEFGKGVLYECLKSPGVESVLVINRKPCGMEHEKLTEIIHPDFNNFSSIRDQLSGYNACYFCMGISSLSMKERDYSRVIYDLTLHVAKVLVKINPEMTFCYVSGAGTNSSEHGRSMWARVKGKTENDLLKLPFKAAFMFRPGYIQPIKGLKNTYKLYKVLGLLYPVWKTFFPKYVCTLEDLGLTMINVVLHASDKHILENEDITRLAKKT